MRCVLEAAPFPAAVPDAAGCADGSALSWVELPNSSSHSCLAAVLSPGSPVCPIAAMPAARASGIENCKPPGWLLGGARVAEVMVPLLYLGLHAAIRGSVQGSCSNTHYTPAYKHTSVELCIGHRLIRICFIKVLMNGQEPCFRRCAQHLKQEAKCRRLLRLLWTCCHSSGLLETGGPGCFVKGGCWLCVVVGFHRYNYNVSITFGRIMCSTGFLRIYIQNIPLSIYTREKGIPPLRAPPQR